MRRGKRKHNAIFSQAIPDTLYKYLTPERIDVVVGEKIRFTQPNLLNDPFEVTPVFRGIYSQKELKGELDSQIEKMFEEEFSKYPALKNDPSALKMAVLIASDKVSLVKGDFIELMQNLEPKIAQMFLKMHDKISILSLTEDKNNLLMWSHYANEHRGFVIGFNSAHEFINRKVHDGDEFRHPRRVFYTNKSLFDYAFGSISRL